MLAYGILSARFGRLHALSVRNSFFLARSDCTTKRKKYGLFCTLVSGLIRFPAIQ